MNKQEIERYIKKNGFDDFKWINPKEIIVSQWVRVKCMFGCSDYGLGACPPNTPSVDECKRFFSEYNNAVIIRISKYADKKNYPSDWSEEMTNNLLDIERRIFLDGFPKSFLLNQTCCNKCKHCTGTRLECKDKKNARPSPEAFAVDVYQTLKNVGMDLQVVSENPSEMFRVAILMIN